MNQRRFIPWTWLFALAALTGCATRGSISPDAVVLQDPLPGQSLVYLIRAPYDGLVIRVQVNGKPLVTLPPDSYTALSLPAGKYVLTAFNTSVFASDTLVAPPLEVSVLPDQRVFYAIAGVTERSVGFMGFIPTGSGGVMPLLSHKDSTAAGSRSWKEYTELDARGLITISRLALPER